MSEDKFIKYFNKSCKTCGEQSKKYCSDCKLISYCSEKCQKKDWIRHRPICIKRTSPCKSSTKIKQDIYKLFEEKLSNILIVTRYKTLEHFLVRNPLFIDITVDVSLNLLKAIDTSNEENVFKYMEILLSNCKLLTDIELNMDKYSEINKLYTKFKNDDAIRNDGIIHILWFINIQMEKCREKEEKYILADATTMTIRLNLANIYSVFDQISSQV